jgi:hypothetical protein
MSIYAKFNPEDTFYFSNAFSDYYKEDFKTFTNKMPMLKAKIKTNALNLKRVIKRQNIKSSHKEKKLYEMLKRDNLVLKKQDLIISAERKNPVPLMKSIFKQVHPGSEEIKEHIRQYFKTMKPIGNDDGNTDYTKNNRWKLNRELIKFRKGIFKEEKKNDNKKNERKRKLILSYYNANDPDIQKFNKYDLDENQMDYSFENNKAVETINKNEEQIWNNVDGDMVKSPIISEYKQSNSENPLFISEVKKQSYSIRPLSSYHSNITKKKDIAKEKLFDNKDYNSLNTLPVKANSKINNFTYNKMNEFKKEKKFMKKNSKDYYFMTQPGNIHIETDSGIYNLNKNSKIPGIHSTGIFDREHGNYINNENYKNNQKCDYIFFNEYIGANHDLEIPAKNFQYINYYPPMNCFSKLSGNFYTCSQSLERNKKNSKKFYKNKMG